MKKNFSTAILFTLVTTVLLGLVYPAAVTVLAQVLFRNQANGQLISKGGELIGSRIIAQPFTGPQYFHPRPSAAGVNGYDASSSSGSNLGPTSQKLVDRVKGDVAKVQTDRPGQPVPIEMVTTSGSGLDPDISPEAARFQVARVARVRGTSESELALLVNAHVVPRQFGFLGESRVNVLELNLELDRRYPARRKVK
ncbi:MAG TPA: potassium-transporting ATPase subunit KdpC [Candidatus Angelobacter sp.]|nr:potassium-transporting ATPase subunit KdpC [Candidatus Angelobacter sp.]